MGGDDTNSKKLQFKLKLALIIVQSTVVTIALCFMIGLLATSAGTELNNEFISSQKIFTVVTFSTFLVVYVLILFLLTSRLKKYFPRFYSRESPKIFLSKGIIIGSILSRIGANVFIFFYQDEIN